MSQNSYVHTHRDTKPLAPSFNVKSSLEHLTDDVTHCYFLSPRQTRQTSLLFSLFAFPLFAGILVDLWRRFSSLLRNANTMNFPGQRWEPDGATVACPGRPPGRRSAFRRIIHTRTRISDSLCCGPPLLSRTGKAADLRRRQNGHLVACSLSLPVGHQMERWSTSLSKPSGERGGLTVIYRQTQNSSMCKWSVFCSVPSG